jgi:putative oxidoreductase
MNVIRKPLVQECSNHIGFLIPTSVARWAPISLRLIVGYGFMQHGFAKLSKGPEAFAAILHLLGVPAPHLMAWLTIATEVFGGLAVLLGAFVPLVSLPMAALLLVAIFTVYFRYGFSSIKLLSVNSGHAQFGPPGYECDLLYLACLATLVLAGSGPLAIDDILRRGCSRFQKRVECGIKADPSRHLSSGSQFARLVQLCEPCGRQEHQSTVNVKVAEETIELLTESLPVSVMV